MTNPETKKEAIHYCEECDKPLYEGDLHCTFYKNFGHKEHFTFCEDHAVTRSQAVDYKKRRWNFMLPYLKPRDYSDHEALRQSMIKEKDELMREGDTKPYLERICLSPPY